MTALAAALDYARMGVYVFPCNGKEPLVKWGTESTNNPETVTKWWTQWPEAGIGVDCGRSHLVVVDLDVKNGVDGPGNWKRRQNGHDVPATFYVRTPSGGWHLWFRDPTGRYRNSASQVAPGVDVRAVGGYVLAPGSPGYRWHTEAPLTISDIPPMPDGVIPTATGGGTGHWSQLDRTTLDPRDLAALEALEKLHGHGAYRSAEYVAITRPGKTAGASATIGHIGPGIVRVFTPNWPGLREGAVYDADELTRIASGDTTGGKYDPYYLTRSALATLPRGESLIEGVLDRHTLFVVAGRDQSYKSFLTLGWLLSLATGYPWLGHDVERGKVLYVVGEGAWGLNDRVSAWEQAWGQTVDDDWFHVRRAPLNLYRHTDAYTDLIDRVAVEQYTVVVFDTLQRMSSGADQNSARDAGIIITALDQIRQTVSRGAVGVVAHTDKGDNDTRGSSAFEDDADIVWRVKKDQDDQTVRAVLDKRKDGPAGTVIELQPRLIPGSGSLVLEYAGGLTVEDRQPPRLALPLLRKLAEPVFRDSGAAYGPLAEALGVKGKGSLHRALNHLLSTGLVEKTVPGLSHPRYKITVPGLSHLDQHDHKPLTSTNTKPSQLSHPVPSTVPPELSQAVPPLSHHTLYVVEGGTDGTADQAETTWDRWPKGSFGEEANS